MFLRVVAPATGAEGGWLEFRPTLSVGYSRIVEPHGSFSAAARINLGRYFLVQPEYLVLPAADHTDHGPALLLGLSGGNRDGLRPFVGVGGGPLKGYQGDDGIAFLALGASHPLARRQRLFLQSEIRYGILGESRYSQFAVGIGISR